uniref:Putative cysteine-rich receptor-like protein kinase 33 n=1 Tax=Aegilops tauschii TaxID=37682 RepID=R7W7R4_AEGTA
MAQNPAHDSLDLYPGIALTVPLRCACPSPAQTSAGVKYLVTYLLDWDDDASTVTDRFRADYQTLLHANSITDDTTVYPFTTMLVPLKDKPTSEIAVLPEPPTPSPSPAPSDVVSVPPASSAEASSGPRWRVAAGVAAGCSSVLTLGAVLALFLLCRWCRRHGDRGDRSKATLPAVEHAVSDGPAKGALTRVASLMWPMVVREAVGSLTVYDYGDLERATSGFSEEQCIGNSSVYRAVINGSAVAVKRVPGDVGTEVTLLGRVNHSSLIRMSGLCMHGGYTYMAFEFAENGALSDWLHSGEEEEGRWLGWSQGVQVALGVAGGLNYLHNYTDPPYVHKNLKGSNILLDACFRAKLSNFGLALAITADDARGGLWMTRHVVGTQGYLAPEYLEHGLIGSQLDVFAFGVLVLQLLSGKEAARQDDDENGKVVLLWEEAERLGLGGGAGDLLDKVTAFVDGRLHGRYPLDVVFAMLALALRCVAREPRTRPSMAEVLLSLSGMYNWTINWDPRCPDPEGTGTPREQ